MPGISNSNAGNFPGFLCPESVDSRQLRTHAEMGERWVTMTTKEYLEFLESQPHFDWIIMSGRSDDQGKTDSACSPKEALQRAFAAVCNGADYVFVTKR